MGITGYIGAKIKRAKFVFNVADIWPQSAVELGILINKLLIRLSERLEKFLYKKSWKIATATEGIKEYIINKGKDADDVFLLPNGVNTDEFVPRPKDSALLRELDLHGKKVFMYAGTMGYAQGLDSVLNAANILKDKEPNIHFLFVGDGQDEKNS